MTKINPYLRTVQDVLNEEIVERLKVRIDDVKRALDHLNTQYPNDRESQKQIDWILLKNLQSILNGVKPE